MAICPNASCQFNYMSSPYEVRGRSSPGNTPVIILECPQCHTTLSVAVDVAALMKPEVDRLIAALKDATS